MSVFRAPPGRFTIVDGKMVPVPKDKWRTLRAEEQFDAILYLGPASLMKNKQPHEIPPALCSEPGFLTRQVQRMALSVPPFEADRLTQYCADIRAQ